MAAAADVPTNGRGAVIKLYRLDCDEMRYWEAWADGPEVVVHYGSVGARGRTERLAVSEGVTADALIHARAAPQRALGFTEIPPEEHAVLEVVYPADRFDDESTDPMDLLDAAEDRLNESLGWTGLGRCVNFDYSGDLTLTADVVDAGKAVDVVRRAFDADPELAGYAIRIFD